MYIRSKKYLAVLVMLFCSVSAFSQITTQSPYSRFGLGNLRGSLLPQYRALGGVSTAINSPNGYSNINVMNPSAYAGIGLTTIEVGVTGGLTSLKKGNLTEKSFNSTLSHVALGFPVTSKSGLSFGLLPYSELGYDFKNTAKIDTINYDYNYTGEGGLSKAYIGYGYQFGDNFRVGANIEYIFGNLLQTRTTEFLSDPSSMNVRIQEKNSIYGLNFSYGAQYDVAVNSKVKMIIGYSGSSSSRINTKQSFVVTRFTRDFEGNENPAIDTPVLNSNAAGKLQLPLVHNFGIAFQQYNKWLIGIDVRMGNWSDLTINGANQGLENSFGASIGAQITPNIGAVSGYFNRIDYRFGLQYDKTYVRISNTDIKQMSASLGFGFPFASLNRYTFTKLNFTTEFGQRGTLSSNLVKENFINFHIGVTLNDKWFNRFKFD